MNLLEGSTTSPNRSQGNFNTVQGRTDDPNSRPYNQNHEQAMKRRNGWLFEVIDGLKPRASSGNTGPNPGNENVDPSFFAQGSTNQNEQWNTSSIAALDQIQNLAEQRTANPRTAPTLRLDVLTDQAKQEVRRMPDRQIAQTLQTMIPTTDGFQLPEEVQNMIKVLEGNRGRYSETEIKEAKDKALELVEDYTTALFESRYQRSEM